MKETTELIAELAYQVRRLSEILESDSERREAEYKDLIARLERQNVGAEKMMLVLSQAVEQRSTDDPLKHLRKVVDEIRQGLYLRDMGLEPWPKRDTGDTNGSPPSLLPLPPRKRKDDDTASFRLKPDGGAILVLGKMTLGRVWSIAKWATAAGAAVTGAWYAIKAIWRAIVGGHI